MTHALMAALAGSVAAGYFTIALVVAPRIKMPSVGDRVVFVVRAAAIAFFIGCGMTHVHILLHTLGVGTPQPVEAHELVFHTMQAIGAWLFILGAILRLELHIVPAQSRRELRAAIEEQRQAWEEAQELALLDDLTGLARRRRFEEALALEVARSQRYGATASLLVVDIDEFKAVNDSHGHHAGDALLKQLGQTLRASLRDTDLPARIGGDEFAVILPETGIDDAEQVAQKLVDLFDPTSRSEVATASISVGIARIDGGLEDVMKDADAALYRAKRAGGNRYVTSGSRRFRSDPAALIT